MTDIKWGETHCTYCEKPIANGAQYDESKRIEKEHGFKSPESVAYDAQFCWEYPNFQCTNYAKDREYEWDTVDRRFCELLVERDTLRAEVERLRTIIAHARIIVDEVQLIDNTPMEARDVRLELRYALDEKDGDA